MKAKIKAWSEEKKVILVEKDGTDQWMKATPNAIAWTIENVGKNAEAEITFDEDVNETLITKVVKIRDIPQSSSQSLPYPKQKNATTEDYIIRTSSLKIASFIVLNENFVGDFSAKTLEEMAKKIEGYIRKGSFN